MSDEEIKSEITFSPDCKGPAQFVRWRGVPVGMVRPLNRVPRLRPSLSKEARRKIREGYKPLIGKWYDTFGEAKYFDTREDAAVYLVNRVLTQPSHSPMLQAAIRGDSAKVGELLAEMRFQVQQALERNRE
jgi:hypothetical protein